MVFVSVWTGPKWALVTQPYRYTSRVQMCVLRRRDGLSQPSSFFFLMALLRGQCAEATLPSEAPPPPPSPFCRAVK